MYRIITVKCYLTFTNLFILLFINYLIILTVFTILLAMNLPDLGFAEKDCHFLFNSVLYEQIDGVAMGSPVDLNSLIFFFLGMNIHGLLFVLHISNPFIIAGTLMIVSYFFVFRIT